MGSMYLSLLVVMAVLVHSAVYVCVCVCVCVSVSPPGDGGCDGDHVAHELDNDLMLVPEQTKLLSP